MPVPRRKSAHQRLSLCRWRCFLFAIPNTQAFRLCCRCESTVSCDEDGFEPRNTGTGSAMLHTDQLKRVRQIELVPTCDLLCFGKSIEAAEFNLVHTYPRRTPQVAQQYIARRKILLLRNLVAKPFAFKHAQCLCETDARDAKASPLCEIAAEVFGPALLQDELYSGGRVQVTRFDVTEAHYCSDLTRAKSSTEKSAIKADKICIIRLPPGSMAAESHCMSRRVVAPAVSRG
jgi:hypothetical protein